MFYKKFTENEFKVLKDFLNELNCENISEEIKKRTIQIRKSTNVKLPDCIIAATSIALKIPLVTADKQLSVVEGLDIILYQK